MSKIVKAKQIAKSTQSRVCIAKIIADVFAGHSLTDAFKLYLAQVDVKDKAFVKEVCYGVLRHYSLLDASVKKYLTKKLKQKYILVHYILVSAFYQLHFLKQKSHAVVNESVNACYALGLGELSKLTNGLLRNFIRDDLALISSTKLEIKYSYPSFLIKKIAAKVTEDKLISLLENGNAHAPMFLRVENSKIATDEYLNILKQHGIKASICPICPSAIKLDKSLEVTNIPLFEQGFVTVQDLSAQMAAKFLPLKDYDVVLDACAAPGGKSAHLLDINNTITLYAFDAQQERVELINSTLTRLQRHAHVQQYDARYLHQLNLDFDAILLDVPCSGTGVIRRHPDIKWLRRESDFTQLVALQYEILQSAFKRLKIGGFLLYTTCSIVYDENEGQIRKFLSEHKSDVKLIPLKINNQSFDYYQRYTGTDASDGFFYSLLQKIA